MISYSLSADELLLVYLCLISRDEEGHPEYFAEWYSNGGQSRLHDLFLSLKSKGIILKDYNPEKFNPMQIPFNKNFVKAGYKNCGELGQELFDEYPSHLNIKGKYVPLRNIAKKFNSLEDFFFYYSSTIGHNPDKHKEVMEQLDYAKKNDLINYSILEGVASQKGNEIKEIRNSDEIIETVGTTYEDI